ncbi:DNA recombination protein RmuC [Cognatiluteimonas telluris]|jgi:DNA recombination protein RmuC|uniref:DNA recombination protein RmuC n=1 Tax=Cognatiluteimonas telluris TaxID=1104775 RepID=UPI00140A9639|nr:DNA recombination protein RmuC [Lysobacter telluris]
MTATLLILLFLAVLVAIAMLGLLLRRGLATAPQAMTELERLAAELAGERDNARLQSGEIGSLNGRLGALESTLAAREEALARTEAQRAELQQHNEQARQQIHVATVALAEREAGLAEAQGRLARLESELARLREQAETLQIEHAQANANLAHARQANVDMHAFLAEAQTRLSGAFSELAGKVFDERGQQFEKNVQRATSQSKSDIETLLKPFADQLGQFRIRVDTLYSEEAKERSMLLGAVNELKTLNQDMAQHTDALTRALKGNAKVRGDWGELMLESVLRGSGLEEGRHYDRQKKAVDQDGARLHPDVVVRLPDERRVVVDSKVNLIAWQEAMNAQTPEQQDEAMRRHAAGLRQHVRDLGEKNYPKAVGDSALEITIAFVPIEGALSAALGFDPALQTDAFDRRVVFASPNTLMALLRVVERLWTRDKIQREAVDIAKSGGLVLDALMTFLADFDRVGQGLQQATEAFNTAHQHLRESSKAVIPRARRLASLGVQGKKPLRDELKPDASDPEDAARLPLLDLPIDDGR